MLKRGALFFSLDSHPYCPYLFWVEFMVRLHIYSNVRSHNITFSTVSTESLCLFIILPKDFGKWHKILRTLKRHLAGLESPREGRNAKFDGILSIGTAL